MVFVFGSFVLNGDPTVKQFGIGLAVAVILDATVVRCLLVPALMVMIGKVNWYMPRWLDRIVPQISIEGAEFFDERDRRRSPRTRSTTSRIGLARESASQVESPSRALSVSLSELRQPAKATESPCDAD